MVQATKLTARFFSQYVSFLPQCTRPHLGWDNSCAEAADADLTDRGHRQACVGGEEEGEGVASGSGGRVL